MKKSVPISGVSRWASFLTASSLNALRYSTNTAPRGGIDAGVAACMYLRARCTVCWPLFRHTIPNANIPTETESSHHACSCGHGSKYNRFSEKIVLPQNPVAIARVPKRTNFIA